MTVDVTPNTNPSLNQPYKLTTKELEPKFDLNLYDFGARTYPMDDYTWWQPDPLAEKHYNISPYAYCGNNPVNRIDPTGMTDYAQSSVSDRNFNKFNVVKDKIALDEVVIRPEKPVNDGSLNVVQAAQKDIGRNDVNRALVDQTNNVMLSIMGAGGALPFVMAAAAEGAPIAVTSYLSNPAVWNGGAGTTILGAAGYASEMPGAGTLEGGGTTVIGEGMARVEAAAAKVPGGATILNDMPKFTGTADQITSKMMTYNRQWILNQMRSGNTILDIGKDVNRAQPSIFYQMEQNMLKNYQILHPETLNVIKK